MDKYFIFFCFVRTERFAYLAQISYQICDFQTHHVVVVVVVGSKIDILFTIYT